MKKHTIFKTLIVLVVITLPIFAYLTWQSFADTKIAKTLNTNPDLERGLVGHWTFDGKDMNDGVVDRAGGNTGVLKNFTSTTTVAGKIGQALDFVESNDYVLVPTITTTDSFTVSLWVKWSSSPNDVLLGVSNVGSKYYLSVNDTNAYTRLNATTLYPHNGVTQGVWYNFVVVRNASDKITTYKDGVSLGNSNTATGTFSLTSIGAYKDGTYSLGGSIDDVRIYNRALSSDEIKRLYDLGATTYINKTLTTNPDLERGLVGHWTFDGPELINNATDRSGQGNDGYLTNFTSTTTIEGKIGQALDFDGVDDYVCVLDDSTLDFAANDSFTVSFWVKFNTAGQTQKSLVEKWTVTTGYPYAFRVSSGGSLYWVRWDGTNGPAGTFIASPATNTWYHVVGVKDKDSDNMYSYLDGVLKDTDQDTTTGTTANSSGLGFGDRGCGYNSTYVNATLDDIRIYNRALSQDEVKRLYDLGATTYISKTLNTNPDLKRGLVGHWTFDGPELINNATDRSGQGNDGYLTNFTSTTTIEGKLGQALDFDGSDDYVLVPDSSDWDVDNISIFAWVKAPDSATIRNVVDRDSIISGQRQFQFRLNSAGKVDFIPFFGGTPDTDNVGATVVDDDAWHQIGVTYQSGGGLLRLFVDGVVDYTEVEVGTVLDKENSGLALGIYSATFGNGQPFLGTIDNVRIYNRAISADEVKRLYELGR